MAEIFYFPERRQIERINGVTMNLGRLSLEELQLLEVQCSQRLAEAQDEVMIVRDALARWFPDGGGTAA
jgi:hypothetical protein